jgi:hypothetical protein
MDALDLLIAKLPPVTTKTEYIAATSERESLPRVKRLLEEEEYEGKSLRSELDRRGGRNKKKTKVEEVEEGEEDRRRGLTEYVEEIFSLDESVERRAIFSFNNKVADYLKVDHQAETSPLFNYSCYFAYGKEAPHERALLQCYRQPAYPILRSFLFARERCDVLTFHSILYDLTLQDDFMQLVQYFHTRIAVENGRQYWAKELGNETTLQINAIAERFSVLKINDIQVDEEIEKRPIDVALRIKELVFGEEKRPITDIDFFASLIFQACGIKQEEEKVQISAELEKKQKKEGFTYTRWRNRLDKLSTPADQVLSSLNLRTQGTRDEFLDRLLFHDAEALEDRTFLYQSMLAQMISIQSGLMKTTNATGRKHIWAELNYHYGVMKNALKQVFSLPR